jgi:hypothetical protein
VNLEVDGEGPLLDGLDVVVDDGCLLDGVGSGEGSTAGDDVGALGDGADNLGSGDDVSDGQAVGGQGGAGVADDTADAADEASLGGGDQSGEGSEEFHGDKSC